MDARIELLAEYMHNVWSEWYKHQRDNTEKENSERWERQSITFYKDLSETDKEKDRHFAREIIEIVNRRTA